MLFNHHDKYKKVEKMILVVFLFQEIYKDRKKFSKQVFEVASSDLVNMGITVVSYTLKDIRDDEVISIMQLAKKGHVTIFIKNRNL